VVSTLAGGVSGTNGAYADASGTNAGFRNPRGVAFDASGNVFVGDSFNQRIRKVTAGGGTPIVASLCALTVRIRTLRHRRERSGAHALTLTLFFFTLRQYVSLRVSISIPSLLSLFYLSFVWKCSNAVTATLISMAELPW
jgi:hypothetical protein